MSEKPENPAAFPASGDVKCENGHWVIRNEGMTLRDWFAGQALVGLVHCVGTVENYTTQSAIRDAWKAADLMLAEREKQNKEKAVT